MRELKLKYVQIQPDELLANRKVMNLPLKKRGIYFTLWFLLLANDGSVKLENDLYARCGCREKTFRDFWNSVEHGFCIRKGFVYSSLIARSVKKQKKFLQLAKQAGLRGGRPKRVPFRDPKPKGNENEFEANSKRERESKTKRSESMIPCGTVPEPKVTARKTSASLGAHSRSSNSPRSAQANEQAPNALGADDFNNRRQVNIKSMFFIDKLQKVLFAKSQSDRTCFIRVQKFLEQQVLSNRLGLDAFDKALAFAEEATTGENPNALFMSLVRKQLGFTRKAR